VVCRHGLGTARRGPDPGTTARLTAAHVGAALKCAHGRSRDEKVAAIQAALRTEYLARSAAVTGAYSATVQEQVAILTVLQ
jgi:peptidoglycan hydrolase-like protein with peptidoglycan-binding domain